ncbi:DEAD/DEAH box helicase [Clostridium perfringens]
MKENIYDKKSYDLDTSAQLVFNYIKKKFGKREECICFYQEPRYLTQYGFVPSLVVLDREYGIIIFKTYDYKDGDIYYMGEDSWIVKGERIANQLDYLEDYEYELKNDLFRPVNKLKPSMLSINSFIIFPFLNSDTIEQLDETIQDAIENNQILFSDFNIVLNKLESSKMLKENEWKMLRSVIQKANGLSKSLGIKIKEPVKNLRDAITLNENKIYLLDEEQLDAAMTLNNGCERIRGLAGTGKTIVLSMKAARLHALYPDAKILYTFYTQSLYKQINRLVSIFYKKLTGEDLNVDNQNLKIMHAWGGKIKKGVYSEMCKKINVKPLSYYDMRFEKDPFGKACSKLIDKNLTEEYDYILIDEAQDLPVEFFKLICKISKKPYNIVWAYDELQTTGDVKIPEPDELFGKDEYGKAKISLKRDNDHILKKSYRNNIRVLFLAICLGFGIYSKKGIVQMIDKEETWRALGFKLDDGVLKYGNNVIIERPEKNSPMNIQSYYDKYNVLNYNLFDTKSEELDFISNKIITLVKEESVKEEDIIVIDLNSKSAESNLKYIQRLLFKNEIGSMIPGFVDGVDDFFVEGRVTLTTSRRAKGNEAPIVFVLGIENLYTTMNRINDKINRNLAFIAITRAKGWCFITASGEKANLFEEEYYEIFSKFPRMEFKYPTEKEMDEIGKINYMTSNDEILKTSYENKETFLKFISQDPEMLKALLNDDEKEKILKYLERLND